MAKTKLYPEKHACKNWVERLADEVLGIEVKEPLENPVKEKVKSQAYKRWEYNHKTRVSPKAGDPKVLGGDYKRSLTDEEAIACRKDSYTTSTRKLALRYGVSEQTIVRCVKGYSYKHLNHIAKPRF